MRVLDDIRAYRGNPLIKKLGEIRSEDEWREKLGSYPAIDDRERSLRPHERIHVVTSLFRQIYVPRPDVTDLALTMDEMLYSSYVGRSPTDGSRARLLSHLPKTDKELDLCLKQVPTHESINMSSVAGPSGIGKTTALQRILTSHRQMHWHESLGIHQVVWLKIDIPSNGSVRQMGQAFIFELERLLGERLPMKVTERTTAVTLMRYMMHLCATYSIGLLVIDEIQNLTAKKSEGRAVMLNFFQELANLAHVAVLLVGTPKALEVFETGGRVERRVTAFGSYAWDRLNNDEEWELMLEVFWRYQLTDQVAPLTDEIRGLLYDATQGILALLPAILNLAQNRAILANKLMVTSDILRWVEANRFKPMHRALRALRSGDPRQQSNYEDLYMGDFMREIQAVYGRDKQLAKQKLLVKQQPLPASRQARLSLLEIGYEIEDIDEAIEKVAEPGLSAAQFVRRAQELLLSVEAEDEAPADDLRRQISIDPA